MAILLAVITVWFVAVYRPQSNVTRKTEAQVDKLSTEIKAITATEKRIAKLRRRLAFVDSSIQRIESRIYAKQRLPEVLLRMESQGRKYGLRFKSIFPDYTILFTEDSSQVSANGLMRVPVHFIMEGSYKSFGRYLESFPGMPWTVTVGGVDIRLMRESYPRLLIDLLAYIYVYDETKGGRERLRLLEAATDAAPDKGSPAHNSSD